MWRLFHVKNEIHHFTFRDPSHTNNGSPFQFIPLSKLIPKTHRSSYYPWLIIYVHVTAKYIFSPVCPDFLMFSRILLKPLMKMMTDEFHNRWSDWLQVGFWTQSVPEKILSLCNICRKFIFQIYWFILSFFGETTARVTFTFYLLVEGVNPQGITGGLLSVYCLGYE